MRIASVGACTAVGLDTASTAAAVRAGISGFAEHPFIVDDAGDRVIVAPASAPDQSTAQRLAAMACIALHETLAQLPALSNSCGWPLYLSIPSLRPGLDRADVVATVTAIRGVLAYHRLKPEIFEIDAGHSGGILAVEACCDALSHTQCTWALAGGFDSWLDTDALELLQATDRLHNAANPWGLVPGEASAFCALTRETESERSAEAHVRIAGFGTAAEPIARRGEEPCLGRGLTTAIQDALQGLTSQHLIAEVLCDYNGEWDRADEYGFAVVRTRDHFVDATATRTPADCWGDVGAATGTLLVALSWQAARQNWLAGNDVLIWTSSDGPQRAALRLVIEP